MIQLLKGKILNDQYRIRGTLGRGGFGAVYLAEDLKTKVKCAIKENLDDSSDTRSKFLREASILYNLEHPHLPAVSNHFVIPGEGQYLVMEFVEGTSLIELLDRRGRPLPEDKVVTWISQVCDALDYLHSQRPPIIHRDIKPGNIRITPKGDAVLVDFGIAKYYDQSSRTSTVARAVTPGYSPLEQYGIGRTDARSDVYALGVTTYKLLTDQIPEPSVDIAAGTVEPPRPAYELNPKVSKQVSAAISRAMQLKIDDRTQDIAQFKAELQRSPTLEDPEKRKSPLQVFSRLPGGLLLIIVGVIWAITMLGVYMLYLFLR
jgi:serine/threonine-protein kinase